MYGCIVEQGSNQNIFELMTTKDSIVCNTHDNRLIGNFHIERGHWQ